MKQLSINHICPSFNNIIYQLLVEEQIKDGDEIRVFYFTQRKTGLPNGDKEYVDGISPFTFIDRFFFFVKEAKVQRAYDEIYKDRHFDIIHAHTLFTSGYIAYKHKKKYGTPYIVAIRGTDVNLFFKKRFYLRGVGIRILQNADALVFLSTAHKQQVFYEYVPRKMINSLEKKSYVIPNGIDNFWHINECFHSQMQPDRISIIYYGDIDKNKNLRTTISACEILINRGYRIEYNVIGRVYDKSVYEVIKAKEYIRYTDFLPKEELIKKLRQSDIFVMPSYSETFGLSYVEAMSQGLPVIYTKGQGFDKTFDEGEVGYGVSPNDSNGIADAILKIINNYQKISLNCTKKSGEFNWEVISKKYKGIYNDIIQKHNENTCNES